jgi:uncharacterized protein YdbL (DUF1318 family)
MRRLAVLSALTLAIAGAAGAQNNPAISAARAAGAVGERFDGYLGIAAPSGESVRSAVGAINLKRRSLYSGLAARKGVSPQEVGITASCQLFARVAVGEAYLLDDRVWRRRAAGQPAPRPEYCGR